MEVLSAIHKVQECLKCKFTHEEFTSGAIGQLMEPSDFTPEASVSFKHIITHRQLLFSKVQVLSRCDQGFLSKINFHAPTENSRAHPSTTKTCLIQTDVLLHTVKITAN